MKLTTATIAAYVTLQNASGIKVGDTVKVVRATKDNELGWDNIWVPEMTLKVGTTFSVLEVSGGRGIAIEDENGDFYQFPFFVLEKVEPKIPRIKSFMCNAECITLEWDGDHVDINIGGVDFDISELKCIIKEATTFHKLHQSNK
jgi:hypothetical protein